MARAAREPFARLSAAWPEESASEEDRLDLGRPAWPKPD